jgi:type IV pilus assembly protein PilO
VVKDYYAELPIDTASGNYRHDIGAFASDTWPPRIVTSTTWSCRRLSDGGLVLAAVAKTFRYL